MNYSQSIEWLFGLQRFGVKLGLSKVTGLLKHLGNPHERLRCIHIGGSNGKGSTGVFLHSMLGRAGYCPGFYTSPHLVDFTERIRIGDRLISKSRVKDLISRTRAACDQNGIDKITYFEFVTAMAFTYFEEEKADPVIVEVGLGGRCDATNVIKPLVSVISSISLEHPLYLGNAIADIAREKAGIIKPGVPLISSVSRTPVKDYFQQVCRQRRSRLIQLGRDIKCRKLKPWFFSYRGMQWRFDSLRCGLAGDHQFRNAAAALAACEIMNTKGIVVTPQQAGAGISSARWAGRQERIRENPDIVLDGAHNPEAWHKCIQTIRSYYNYRRLFLLLGVMADKDISKMFEILTPEAHTVVICRPEMDRSADRKIIEKFVRFSKSNRVFWQDSAAVALRWLMRRAGKNDLICVTGSLFVVGECRELLTGGGAKSSGRIGM